MNIAENWSVLMNTGEDDRGYSADGRVVSKGDMADEILRYCQEEYCGGENCRICDYFERNGMDEVDACPIDDGIDEFTGARYEALQ